MTAAFYTTELSIADRHVFIARPLMRRAFNDNEYRPRASNKPTFASGFEARPPEGASARGITGTIAGCEWTGMASFHHDNHSGSTAA